MSFADLAIREAIVAQRAPQEVRWESLSFPRKDREGALALIITFVFLISYVFNMLIVSFAQAALTGNLNVPMRFEELSALSPVVRKEVLTGELSRRIKTMDGVLANEVDSLVESIAGMALVEVLEGIQNPNTLQDQIRNAREINNGGQIALPRSETPSSLPAEYVPPAENNSTLAPSPAPASAPEHPSTPISIAPSLSDPPRTSSPSGSLIVGTEKDKLLASVTKYEPAHAQEITDLLLSLSKKERAMCLFNPDYLKSKIADAKMVLEAEDDEDAEKASVGTTAATVANVPTNIVPAKVEMSKPPSPIITDLPTNGHTETVGKGFPI